VLRIAIDAVEGKVYVSTVLFSNYARVLHDREDISKIEPMTDREYQVGGSTAIVDALGGATFDVGRICSKAVHRYFSGLDYCLIRSNLSVSVL